MSFSKEVKEELSRHIPSGRHCCIAETAAIISLCGHVKISSQDRFSVKIQTENIAVARKYPQVFSQERTGDSRTRTQMLRLSVWCI